jgi:hypothetical protein
LSKLLHIRGADEELMSRRIAEQEAELERLTKQRENKIL